MKKHYILVLSFFILSILICCMIAVSKSFFKEDLTVGTKNIIGNSNGNIVNNAFVSKQGEWIYCHELFNSYALNINDNRKISFGNKSGRNVNVVDNLMFFTISEGWGGFTPSTLYCRDLKTNKLTKIPSINAKRLIVYDTWLYYIDSGSECLCKAKYDGTEITKITDFAIHEFNIIDGMIYATTNNIMVLTLDGNIVEIKDFDDDIIPLSKSNIIFTDGEMLFISGYQEKYGIAKISLDSLKYVQLTHDHCVSFNIKDDYIYFVKEKDFKLYKIKIDGTEEQLLYNEEVGRTKVNIIDDWIYYLGSMDKICRVRINGTFQEN